MNMQRCSASMKDTRCYIFETIGEQVAHTQEEEEQQQHTHTKEKNNTHTKTKEEE